LALGARLISGFSLEHVAKKLIDFFDKDMLQLFEFERFLFDHVIPRYRKGIALATVKKAGRVARGRAQMQETALERKLARLSRGEPPALRVRQRRRIFCEFAEKNGAAAKGLRGRNRPRP
jgi:hypothetical protein